jgi:magnesium transporter
MITTLIFHKNSKTFKKLSDPTKIADLKTSTEQVLWVDVTNPDAEEFRCVEEQFGFHPLAMEDCRNAHQRPKIEDYHGYYFLVFYDATLSEKGELILQEINMFLGHNYIVTVHRKPYDALSEVETQWRNWTDLAEQGAGLLAYLILDVVVDRYFPVLDSISDRIDEMEDALFKASDTAEIEEIFQIKKQLLKMRRSVSPLRDALNTLLRREQPIFAREIQYYFQDVYDHLIRIADMIDNTRDLLSSTVDIYLSIQSNRMNMVMKRMTAVSTILMTMAIIPGVYGMNFVRMPELQWFNGYYWALGLMLLVGSSVVIFFRWIKWL